MDTIKKYHKFITLHQRSKLLNLYRQADFLCQSLLVFCSLSILALYRTDRQTIVWTGNWQVRHQKTQRSSNRLSFICYQIFLPSVKCKAKSMMLYRKLVFYLGFVKFPLWLSSWFSLWGTNWQNLNWTCRHILTT